jgi:hypothetical protein
VKRLDLPARGVPGEFFQGMRPSNPGQ